MVMLIVRHRRIHPPPHQRPVKPLRIQLEPQMTVYIVHDAQDKEYENMPGRHRIVNKMIGKISDSRNASIGPNAYAAHGEGFTDR